MPNRALTIMSFFIVTGSFPLGEEFCIFWVTMDVLMCTASIWHMCTMSMDRFFTLKYPMKYGRNKTKMTVALKIMFVWAVSITVSSPIFILAVKDKKTVFNHGVCVPTNKDFVIYGSVFAFYIPLTIMIVTYVLTIRILWLNQAMMQKIERSDLKPLRSKFGSSKCIVKTFLSPPSNEGSRKVSIVNEGSETDATILGTFSPQNETKFDNNNKEYEEFLPTKNLDQKAASMSCLPTTSSPLEIIETTATDDEEEINTNVLTETDTRNDFLNVTSNQFFSSKERPIYAAASFSNVPKLDSGMYRASNLPGNLQSRSCGNLDRDSKFDLEWKNHYYQIQKEMDQCLKESAREKKEYDSENSPSRALLEKSQSLQNFSKDDNYLSIENSQISGLISDSGDSIDDMDSSSSSDVITINLKPNSFHMYRLNLPKDSTSPLLGNSDRNKKSMTNGHCHMMTSGKSTPNRFGSPRMSLSNGTNPDHHHHMSKSIRNLLKRFNRHEGMKEMLSKRATTNEKKASKVLGIIFGVFLILWTPFFIVNIMSVSCPSCMVNMTNDVMSIFLWMGYTASLANPIIYTMFNTAFRRTFTKILACHLCRYRGRLQADSSVTTFATSHNHNSRGPDRRNTLTVLLKEDAR